MFAMIKPALALAGAAALIASASACGSSSTHTGSSSSASVAQTSVATTSTSTPAAPATSTSDAQTAPAAPTTSTPSAAGGGASGPSASSAQRGGDESIQRYGSAAGSSDKAAVTAAVKAYYAAIAAGDGVKACALLDSTFQQSLSRSLGRSPLLRSKGCAGIIQLLFQHRPGQPGRVSAAVTVTGVRLNGDHGFALITTHSIPAGEISVGREHGSWKVGSLIGSALG
jgi:hypothetical protein